MKIGILLLFLIISNVLFGQIPTISSFLPKSGKVGDTITITGNNFSPNIFNNKVFFGYTQANVISSTITTLKVQVPIGANHEPIKVINVNSSLSATSIQSFLPIFSCSGSLNENSFSTGIELNINYGGYLAIDDLDGDGIIDFLSGNETNGSSFKTIKNNSEPSLFSFDEIFDQSNLSNGKYLLADIDGDGKKDIISSKTLGGISIVRNISEPGYIIFDVTQKNISTSTTTGKMTVGDLDGDGKPDLVIASSSSNRISILRNTSTVGVFSFATAVNYSSGFNPNTPYLADIDEDGKLDICTTNENDNNISVFKNLSTSGNISFATRVNFATGIKPQCLFISDMDNDGKQDLIVTNYISNSISIIKNTSILGSISFATKIDLTTSGSPSCLSINDMDGDGRPDIVVGNQTTQNFVDIFVNNSSNGILVFNSPIVLNTGNILSLRTADMDGDQKPDIVILNSTNKISLFRNKINGPTINSFTPTIATTGMTITLTGSNFEGTTNVKFEGVPATSFNVLSSTIIEAQVGFGKTGFIEVITPCGVVKEPLLTIVPNIPRILSFYPDHGPVGTTVTLTGENFNPITSKNIVTFGSIPAKIISGSGTTELIVEVPLGSNYHPISVLEVESGLITTSSKQFVTNATCVNPLGTSFFTPSQIKINKANVNGSTKYIDNADFDSDGKPDLVILGGVSDFKFVSIYRNASNIGEFLFDSSTVCNTVFGANPITILPGDMDGDGKVDLILLNNTTSNITIYKNTSSIGNISFAPGIIFSVGSNPKHAAIADLNRDGKLDVIIMYNSSISVLKNTSIHTIKFAPIINYSTSFSPNTFIEIADMDGDQMPEVVLANGSSTFHFAIIPNTSVPGGDISLGTKVMINTFGSLSSLCIGDIDRDGKQDIAVQLSNNPYVTVYRNLTTSVGTFLFDYGLNLALNQTPSSGKAISLSDLDGDAVPELVVLNSSNIKLFKNNSTLGTLAFGDPIDFSTNAADRGFTVRDFDGDQVQDIISIYGSNSTMIRILRGSSNIPMISYFKPVNATSGSVVEIVGQNLTSVTDIKFANTSATSFNINSPNSISAIVGPTPINSVGNITMITSCGSVNRSGYSSYQIPQIISISPTSGKIGSSVIISGYNFNSTLSNNIVFFGAVKATIIEGSTTSITVKVPAGATLQPITIMDNISGLTGISNQPFVITNPCTPMNINTSTFAPKVDYSVGANPLSVTVGDLDGDEKPDIISTNGSSNSISVLLNTSINNSLSFAPKIDFIGKRFNKLFDITGDGKLDLISVNSLSKTISVSVNTSSSGIISFAPSVDFPTDPSPRFILVDDLDGDGKMDILLSYNTSPYFSIYRNIGSLEEISFDSKMDFFTSSSYDEIRLSDLDGDNRPEIIAIRANQKFGSRIYKNTSKIGSISFTSSVDIVGGNDLGGICIGDFDKDGKPDIAFTSPTDKTVSVARNTSSYGVISFDSRIIFTTANYPNGIYANDIDGDGKLDMVTTNFGSASISVFKNTSIVSGSISFTNKLDFAAGNYPSEPFISDLTGDGRPEIIIVTQSMNIISIFKNTIISSISAPITSNVSYCQNELATTLNATGTSLLWYSNPSGGIGTSLAPTPSTSEPGTIYYYVSQTNSSGCESQRASIKVVIYSIPSMPDVISPVNYCKNDLAKPLIATGSSLKWYTTLNNGIGSAIVPTPLTNTSGTFFYYVTQTISGCESTKAQIDVVISSESIPSPPMVISPVIYNENDMATPLNAIGTDLLWYQELSGGVGSILVPTPTTNSSGNLIYYVTQTINGCESPRASITVIVNPPITNINPTIKDDILINIYPNPTHNNFITIEINPNLIGKRYSLTDQAGKLILSGEFTMNLNIINTDNLSSGIYIIKIDGEFATNFKFIKY